MGDLESFLAAIRDDPDDDTVRLVFADWLEEHGDPRGEFMRVQCELANWIPDRERRTQLQEREEELDRLHRRAWLRSLGRLPGTRCLFHRGLIEFTTSGALPIKWNPWIQTLRLRYDGTTSAMPLASYLTPSRLKRLSRLDLSGNQLPIEGIAGMVLEQSERLGVSHLRLANNLPLPEHQLPRLPGWPWPRFHSLDWDGIVTNLSTAKSLQTEALWFQNYRPTPPGVHPVTLVNQIGMRLNQIPAGSFLMGSLESEGGHDSDEHQHHVEITKPFYLGIYPVTQGQFFAVTGTNPSHYQESLGGSTNHPVEQVTWDEAVEFCRVLSDMRDEKAAGRVYRLPTEAEWEYACRAGTRTRFSFDDKWEPSLANVMHEYHHTLPVGSFAPNAFGLYDMHGQVREWCQDWYRREYYRHSPVENPPGPDEGESRVLRGGSWDISSELYARSAYRVYFRPDGRLVGIGFRVVCEIA
jgi:uncharacterized protein (TIGR02996 family)